MLTLRDLFICDLLVNLYTHTHTEKDNIIILILLYNIVRLKYVFFLFNNSAILEIYSNRRKLQKKTKDFKLCSYHFKLQVATLESDNLYSINIKFLEGFEVSKLREFLKFTYPINVGISQLSICAIRINVLRSLKFEPFESQRARSRKISLITILKKLLFYKVRRFAASIVKTITE